MQALTPYMLAEIHIYIEVHDLFDFYTIPKLTQIYIHEFKE